MKTDSKFHCTIGHATVMVLKNDEMTLLSSFAAVCSISQHHNVKVHHVFSHTSQASALFFGKNAEAEKEGSGESGGGKVYIVASL